MNELAFESAKACFQVAEIMITEGHYVVMISREENLWILNYLYSSLNNRNDVVFMDVMEFDTKYYEISEEDEDE